MHDAIVVGMGPAGSSAATELARAGLSVLGLEGKPMPRYKVCGGALSARTDRLLEPDYHSVVEETIHRVRFQFAGAEAFEISSPEPMAYMVMRDRFDAYLCGKAREAGAEVCDNERVVKVHECADRVEVETNRERYRAKVVVGADGATSLIARALFAGRRGRVLGALEGEVPWNGASSCLAAGTIVLDLGVVAGGYGWVFPKERRLSVGVAGLHGRHRNPRSAYHGFVRTEPALGGLEVPDGLGHPIPLYSGTAVERLPLTTSRSLLVGDAACLVDPVLGEGIYYAILSGRMAAASIVGHLQGLTPDLTAYDVEVARDIYPEFRVAARMAWTLYTFPQMVHRMICRRPELIQLYAEILKGRETYQSFYAKARAKAKDSFTHLLKDACLATGKTKD